MLRPDLEIALSSGPVHCPRSRQCYSANGSEAWRSARERQSQYHAVSLSQAPIQQHFFNNRCVLDNLDALWFAHVRQVNERHTAISHIMVSGRSCITTLLHPFDSSPTARTTPHTGSSLLYRPALSLIMLSARSLPSSHKLPCYINFEDSHEKLFDSFDTSTP